MNVLEVDFSEKRVWRGIGSAITQGSKVAYDAAPKKAILGYAGIVVALGLWLSPLSQRLHPRVSITLSLGAAGLLALSASSLDDLQDDSDEARQGKELNRALRQTAVESVEATRQYAAITSERVAASQGLPAHLIEPDLLPPKEEGQGYVAGQPSMSDFDALIAEEEKKLGTSTETEESQPAYTKAEPLATMGKPVAAQTQYSFSTRINPRSNAEERLIDLNGHDTYGGLPIVDLAAEMASDPRGCLGFGSTGCGKSELLKQAIAAQVKVDEASDFTVFAHKSGNAATGEEIDYAGLEKSSDCFVFTASQTGSTLEREATRFERRVKVLEGLIEEGCLAPTVVVIDQSNQGIKAANKAHREAKQRREEYNASVEKCDQDRGPIDFKYLAEDYSEFLNTGLVDGRTKKVKLWSFGHANTNKSAGVDHQIKQNVFFIGLGRAGNYQAVENPMKDNRFISSQSDRDRLQAQLNDYLQQHNANGAPVNVVIAITTCGNEGWRLVVLPQYQPVEPIKLGLTNPPKEAPAKIESEPTHNSQAASLEAMLKISYTQGQVEAARRFIPWLRTNHAMHCDSSGLINPQTVWSYFGGMAGSEDMEAVLQVLTDQGVGEFVNVSGGTRWKPSAKLLPQNKTVRYTVPAAKQQAKPKGLTTESIGAVINHLSNKQIGTYHTPSEFLNSSRVLRQKFGIDADMLVQLLGVLEKRDVVAFTDTTKTQFQYKGAIAK